MADKETGGRAFPWCGDLNDAPTICLGMTLRDYFAAKALQGILSHGWSDTKDEYAAKCAYDIADAMLAARSK